MFFDELIKLFSLLVDGCLRFDRKKFKKCVRMVSVEFGVVFKCLREDYFCSFPRSGLTQFLSGTNIASRAVLRASSAPV